MRDTRMPFNLGGVFLLLQSFVKVGRVAPKHQSETCYDELDRLGEQ